MLTPQTSSWRIFWQWKQSRCRLCNNLGSYVGKQSGYYNGHRKASALHPAIFSIVVDFTKPHAKARREGGKRHWGCHLSSEVLTRSQDPLATFFLRCKTLLGKQTATKQARDISSKQPIRRQTEMLNQLSND